MIITVRVKPNAKHQQSVVLQDDIYIVTTKVTAIEGKANMAVQKILAEHFNVPKASVHLTHGSRSRIKMFTIDNAE